MKDQRKLKNYFKTAGLSRGYYLHIFAGGVAFLGILLIYASQLLSEAQALISTIPDAEISSSIEVRLFTVAILFFVCFLAFVICAVFYMIVLGQRVGGPVIAICSYIQELKAGNYDAQRALRKNDELVPILSELQELALVLKQKSAR